MKAAVTPSVNGKWEVREVPRPKPGPNEVLMRITASGLCFTDVHITHGAIPTQFPRTLGHEPVGEIVELGAGVTRRKVGDRVGVPWFQDSCGRCEWCLRGSKQFCQNSVSTGIQTQGSHAEFMLARADATVLIPDAVSDDQAAPIFCAGFTVWSGFRIADPKPGRESMRPLLSQTMTSAPHCWGASSSMSGWGRASVILSSLRISGSA